jgi:hypothetical protein
MSPEVRPFLMFARRRIGHEGELLDGGLTVMCQEAS